VSLVLTYPLYAVLTELWSKPQCFSDASAPTICVAALAESVALVAAASPSPEVAGLPCLVALVWVLPVAGLRRRHGTNDLKEVSSDAKVEVYRDLNP
jgi:hypothetical protein